MLACTVVPVLLGEPEVDEEELVAVPPDSHQKVVRLDVPGEFRFSICLSIEIKMDVLCLPNPLSLSEIVIA